LHVAWALYRQQTPLHTSTTPINKIMSIALCPSSRNLKLQTESRMNLVSLPMQATEIFTKLRYFNLDKNYEGHMLCTHQGWVGFVDRYSSVEQHKGSTRLWLGRPAELKCRPWLFHRTTPVKLATFCVNLLFLQV
jgi:hypothetical protein